MENNIDREFSWNDEIENDGSDFVVLPEGDYDFEVTAFERGRHNGSEKLPPCNKAILSIKVTAPDGQSTTIKHNLFLHSKTEGMLCAFFTAIGQRRKGEKISMNWNIVVGARGRCKVGVHKWKNSNTGADIESNNILKFYEPTYNNNATWKSGEF